MEAYLWIVSFMIFPYLNLGLLSDYKICGDPECESPMSRVQAIKNHKGKDCRFLNFGRGDTIFVYHKLTGKREDLWAGSIDKQFGYFPKDAVQEEEVFATMGKMVETQKSDFFCMDESGYPVDTTHLDTDEDDAHNFQEPESIQISPHSHDTNAQDSFMSTESAPKEREDEDGNKDLINAAERVEDELKTSGTPEEQGGSSSSSWLPSSVTGWLGTAKEESEESEQRVREDEREETKSEASLTSSVTGWLGFGGEGKHDNDEDSVKIREDSFTSTMTGWLGFVEEKKTVTVENEENEETGNVNEPTETFRSRRMSLDLEGSKLHGEEKEDMGTLGWLGSGLSSRLGFGSRTQDSGGNSEGVEEQPAFRSWMEMGMGGIWGFGEGNTGADGSKGSDISQTEKDQTLEQPSGSENMLISQASFSEEIKAETEKESEMKELVNVSSTLQGIAERGDAIDDNIDTSDTKEENILDIDTGIEDFNKDVSIQNSSQIDNKEDNRPIENMGEDNIRGQQISQNDEFIEQPEISLGSDHSLNELDSNSMEQLEGRVEEGENHHIQIKAPEGLKEEGAEVTTQVHKLEESTLMSENSPVSGDVKEKQFNKVTGVSQQGILGKKSPEETQVSGGQEGSNEQSQVVFSSLETEIGQGELGLQQETQPMEVSSHDDGSSLSANTETLSDNVSEDDEGKISSNETTPEINKTTGSPQMEHKAMQTDSDADRFKETVKDQDALTEKEKSYFEEEALNESNLKLTVGSERETGATEGLKQDVKMKKQEEVNEVKEQIMEVKKEGQQRKLEDINKKEIEKKEEVVNISEDGRGLREERQKQMEKLEEGEKRALLEHEQARVEWLKESEEPNEKEQKEKKMAEVSRESIREKGMELREEKQKEAKKLNEKDKHLEDLLEHGNQIRVEELKESEEQNKKEQKAEASREKEQEMELKEETQKEVEQLKEENQETELLEHEQARVESLKESEEPNEKEQKEEKMGEVSGESLREKGMELREERQKEVKKLNEKDKHIEELLEHGNQIRVEELKEPEDQNEKEQKAEASRKKELKEEKQKDVEELKTDENKQTELLEHEQNKKERKELKEKRQNEDDEPKEEDERVKELVEYDNQIRVKELKKYEEKNQKEKKENEKQVQEGQLEHNKTDIWRPELKIFEKELLDNSSLAALVPETNTETEIQKEKEKEVEKQNKEELEEEKEHTMKKVEDGNIDVGGSEDGQWTGKLNDDGNRKEDRDNSGFEEEIRKTYATKTENEFRRDRGGEETHNSAESQVLTSEQTKSTHPPRGTQSESSGAFGLFKNALGFFSQPPTPVMTESTQSVQSFKTNSPETSQPHGSFSPELDFSTDSLHTEATHTTFPPEQPQPHPISADYLLHNAPSVTEAPSKIESPTKHYKSLHHHVNADEAVILLDLFGRHKLQFLDYILTSSEAMTADEDKSILSDIERLLQHHMEMLVAPSMSITDAPQEDKQRTSAIIALQKLGTLLKTVKETVSTGISDVSNHQAGHSSSQTKEKENNSQPSSLHEYDGGEVKDWNYVEDERRDTGSKDKIAFLDHPQPGSEQKGLIKQTLEFIHGVAEDSIIYAHAVMEILVWIFVQAQDFGKDFKIRIQQ